MQLYLIGNINACPKFLGSEGTTSLLRRATLQVQMHRSGASELEKGSGRTGDGTDRNVLMEFIASKATVTLEQLVRKRPFKIVEPTTTLLELARTMSSGSHIVGIRGEASLPGGMVKVITQGMLFKFLAPHLQVSCDRISSVVALFLSVWGDLVFADDRYSRWNDAVPSFLHPAPISEATDHTSYPCFPFPYPLPSRLHHFAGANGSSERRDEITDHHSEVFFKCPSQVVPITLNPTTQAASDGRRNILTMAHEAATSEDAYLPHIEI